MLNTVRHWRVFVEVSEIFILVPALLGLKGNLEMTLASRLSTQANLGHMDTHAEQWKMIAGNLALTQVQAIVVGQLAAVFAIVLSWIPQGKFNVMQGLLLCASSVLTAALASFILGSIMVVVVLLSRRLHINPDNVSTPIAASLGDLTTISLLAAISMLLFDTLETHVWITPLLLCLFICLIPLWWYISHYNEYTHNVLYTGWTPVIGAMIISSLGGLVLDHTVVNFEGIAVFQPVINGVGGNLVAVQASRLSTALHKVSSPGHLPANVSPGCTGPLNVFCGKSIAARTARVLLLMVIPGQTIFMFAIKYLQSSQSVAITVPFAAVYLTASFLQVVMLLYLASWLVNFLWKQGSDPDNSSIPCLTAVGDLLGTILLAAAFYILYAAKVL
jgi:solute carrier family 41